jgi:hypothetical protein
VTDPITPESWTDQDRAAAEREGWDIFQCDGSGGGLWQIQKFDDPDDEVADVITATVGRLWETDEEAWLHIWTVPSDLHARALAFIRALNPLEWDAITETALELAAPAANTLPDGGGGDPA